MPSRRDLLKAALVVAPVQAQKKNRGLYAYVGCYTTEQRHARGDGIHVYRIDNAGAWTQVQRLENLVNPSFLIASRDGRFLYSVHGDENYATAFAIDGETGNLRRLNQATTGGRNGVHQAIDPSGRFMVVANYASATLAVLRIRLDGALEDQSQLVTLEGDPGPHKVEQTSSHPHHVVFDPSGHYVAVPDKGLDRVFVFRFDQTSGRLSPADSASVQSRAGSAPRHIAFHPSLPVAWVLNELNSTVTTYRFDAGTGALKPVQILPSIPADFTGNNTGAEIAVSAGGLFVYASNRGHDSIAVYSVNPKSGALTSVQWVSAQGEQPRFFCLSPSMNLLHATNEVSDSIVTFRVSPSTGKLTPSGQIVKQASPVTIAFVGG
jgi:6-phosphogluconolactonase